MEIEIGMLVKCNAPMINVVASGKCLTNKSLTKCEYLYDGKHKYIEPITLHAHAIICTANLVLLMYNALANTFVTK